MNLYDTDYFKNWQNAPYGEDTSDLSGMAETSVWQNPRYDTTDPGKNILFEKQHPEFWSKQDRPWGVIHDKPIADPADPFFKGRYSYPGFSGEYTPEDTAYTTWWDKRENPAMKYYSHWFDDKGIPAAAKNITSPVQDFRFSEYQGPSKEVEGDYPVGKKGFQFPSFLREGLGAIRDMIPNPLRKGSSNYNPRLQGQMDALKERGMLGDIKWSEYPGYGAGKITGGPLAGQNLVSGFGTNDYNEMLQKRIDYFNRQKTKKGKLTDEQNRRLQVTIAELQTAGGEGAAKAPIAPPGQWQPTGKDYTPAEYSAIGRQHYTGPGMAFEARPSGRNERGYTGGRAQGGYMRSRYKTGGRVGILAAF